MWGIKKEGYVYYKRRKDEYQAGNSNFEKPLKKKKCD
jgi:hypothetical protein